MAAHAAQAEDSGLPRPDDRRLRNERIAATAAANKFDRAITVPFICECSEHRCEDLVRLTLAQFEAARGESDYVVAPEHQVDEAQIVRVRDGVWLYRADTRFNAIDTSRSTDGPRA